MVLNALLVVLLGLYGVLAQVRRSGFALDALALLFLMLSCINQSKRDVLAEAGEQGDATLDVRDLLDQDTCDGNGDCDGDDNCCSS